MKTQKQILAHIEEIKANDFFGFATSDLMNALTFENAKQFLKPEATKKEWEKFRFKTSAQVKKKLTEYIPFAWEKANNCRGLSASRSMSHFMAWVWLLGDEEYFGDLEDYQYYGKDNLVKLCKFYGLDPKKWDDGIRSNGE